MDAAPYLQLLCGRVRWPARSNEGFVGRAAEMRTVASLLERDEVRPKLHEQAGRTVTLPAKPGCVIPPVVVSDATSWRPPPIQEPSRAPVRQV